MAIRAVVFDLFHTLVDTDHVRPPGYHSTIPTAKLLGLELQPRHWCVASRDHATSAS